MLIGELRNERIGKEAVRFFKALYFDRCFGFVGKLYKGNRGIYTGTKSAHKLFGLLVSSAIERFREVTGFDGVIEYYVDDILIHCDEF